MTNLIGISVIAAATAILAVVVARLRRRRQADGTGLADTPERRRMMIVAEREQAWTDGKR
jgi:hypothetical protein